MPGTAAARAGRRTGLRTARMRCSRVRTGRRRQSRRRSSICGIAFHIWVPRKLLAPLQRQDGATAWPAASTIGDILKRAGLVEERGRQRRPLDPPRGPSWPFAIFRSAGIGVFRAPSTETGWLRHRDYLLRDKAAGASCDSCRCRRPGGAPAAPDLPPGMGRRLRVVE
jgi:hypothetical protein